MTPQGKRIVAGALIALAGAFVWAVLSFTYWFFQRRNSGETIFTVIVYAGYAVFVASWFVLPLGGFLGALLPRFVRGCIGPRAFGRGALLGVAIALIASLLTTLMMEWPTISGRATIVNREAWERSLWRMFLFYVVSMSAVCSAWVGVWALRWSRRVCA
jgi:hypothetical protein